MRDETWRLRNVLKTSTSALGRCVDPFVCLDKVKCYVVQCQFVIGRESGCGEGGWA